MTTQEKREKARIRRKKQVARQKMFLMIIIAIVIVTGSIVCGTIFSSAKSSTQDCPQTYKYYKSITIEYGDTLWSIAEQYCSDEYSDLQEYIDELIQVNGLTSETIHTGEHLLVAYFDEEIR